MARNGVLAERGWNRVQPSLQAEITGNYYHVLAHVVSYSPEVMAHAIAELRAWVDDGRLATIGDTLSTGGVGSVPPGEAGT